MFLCFCVRFLVLFAENFSFLCARNPTVKISGCNICKCTCAARFRKDQLQSIHHAKHYELYQGSTSTSKDTTAASAIHSIIRDLTSIIVSSSADSMLKVLQHHSTIKKLSGTPTPSPDHRLFPKTTGVECDNHCDPREIQVVIEHSLGVTALSLANETEIAGSVPLKNELREALGGVPTTHLVSPNETVSQYRHWRRYRSAAGSSAKCSRTSRNELLDLCSSDEEDGKKTSLNLELKKKKMQIMKEFLLMYKNEKEEIKKKRIKYCMNCLNNKNKEVENEMIDYTFDVYTAELKIFDPKEAAIKILEFAE